MKRKPFAYFCVECIEEADVILLGVPFDGGASAGRAASLSCFRKPRRHGTRAFQQRAALFSISAGLDL